MKLVEGMNDLEAIEYCIKMGVDAHSLLKTYRNKDRFTDMKSVASLQKLLTTIHEDVHLAINPKNDKPYGGQKRRHIVGTLRNEAIAKVDKRTENTAGQPTSDEQILMTQYIYNHLYNMYTQNVYMDYSLSGWSKQVGLLDTKKLPTLRFERRISDVHANTPYNRIKASEVVRTFQTDTVYNRNKQVTESALKSLKRSGEIDFIKHFNVMGCDNKTRRVEEWEYDDIKLDRKELLESVDSSIGAYNYAIGNPSPSEKMKLVLSAVSQILAEKHDCKYIYESYEIVSVKEQEPYNVTKEEFEESYWTRLITLTESRQKGYDSKPKEEQTWFARKFYCYNTLVLMEYMGKDTDGLLLQYELQNAVRAKELSHAYDVYENGEMPVGFGWGKTKEDSPEEIENALEDMF
ncbi:MAG TPA: hypothetical protein K8V56_10650 [Sporosarcina psychrophila]|uniref:Uncharacterized protein n=1 Tax=Sporosarcina psychrophila TaxID=1476 RepID=A0A921FZ29_SPOPS|nr:hypothetical protein [Sporosarcina psychrophila]